MDEDLEENLNQGHPTTEKIRPSKKDGKQYVSGSQQFSNRVFQ